MQVRVAQRVAAPWRQYAVRRLQPAREDGGVRAGAADAAQRVHVPRRRQLRQGVRQREGGSQAGGAHLPRARAARLVRRVDAGGDGEDGQEGGVSRSCQRTRHRHRPRVLAAHAGHPVLGRGVHRHLGGGEERVHGGGGSEGGGCVVQQVGVVGARRGGSQRLPQRRQHRALPLRHRRHRRLPSRHARARGTSAGGRGVYRQVQQAATGGQRTQHLLTRQRRARQLHVQRAVQRARQVRRQQRHHGARCGGGRQRRRPAAQAYGSGRHLRRGVHRHLTRRHPPRSHTARQQRQQGEGGSGGRRAARSGGQRRHRVHRRTGGGRTWRHAQQVTHQRTHQRRDGGGGGDNRHSGALRRVRGQDVQQGRQQGGSVACQPRRARHRTHRQHAAHRAQLAGGGGAREGSGGKGTRHAIQHLATRACHYRCLHPHYVLLRHGALRRRAAHGGGSARRPHAVRHQRLHQRACRGRRHTRQVITQQRNKQLRHQRRLRQAGGIAALDPSTGTAAARRACRPGGARHRRHRHLLHAPQRERQGVGRGVGVHARHRQRVQQLQPGGARRHGRR